MIEAMGIAGQEMAMRKLTSSDDVSKLMAEIKKVGIENIPNISIEIPKMPASIINIHGTVV